MANPSNPLIVQSDKSVLLEVMLMLGEYREHLVLVGGWVPELLITNPEEVHVGSIDVDDLPDHIIPGDDAGALQAPQLVGISLADAERQLITNTLAVVGGNRVEAARILGIGERTLYRKIKEYGLK